MHVAILPFALYWGFLILAAAVAAVGAFEDFEWHPLCTSPDECVFPAQPDARSRHAVASMHDSMFIFGGEGDPLEYTTSLMNDLWHYSATTYQWTNLCADCVVTPAPRRHATLSVVETKSIDSHMYTVYLYGGGRGDRNQLEIDPSSMIFQDFWSLTLEVMPDGSISDAASNWTQLCSEESGCENLSPGRRYLSSTATVDGLIYLYGGGYPSRNDVWVFNPSDRTWEEVCPTTFPGDERQTSPCCGDTFETRCPQPHGTVGAMSAGADANSDSFLVYEHLTGSPFVFDVGERKWRGLCTMPFCYNRGAPRELDAPSVLVNDNMVMLEGGTIGVDGSTQQDTWLFDIEFTASVETSMAPRWSVASQDDVVDGETDDVVLARGPSTYAFSSTVALETDDGRVFASFGGQVGADRVSDELWLFASVAPVLPDFTPQVSTPPESTPGTGQSVDTTVWFEGPIFLAGMGFVGMICCCSLLFICGRASYKHHREHEHTAHNLKSVEHEERMEAGTPSAAPPKIVSYPHMQEKPQQDPHPQPVKQISDSRSGNTDSYSKSTTHVVYFDDVDQEEFPFEDYDIAPRKDVIVSVDTPKPPPLSRWNSQETLLPVSYGDKGVPETVEEFLGNLSLQRYTNSFIEEGFDSIMALSMITDDDLTEFGVRRGHKRLIMNAIKHVQNETLNLQNTNSNTHSKDNDVTMDTNTPKSVEMASLRLQHRAITVKPPEVPTAVFHTKPVDAEAAHRTCTHTQPEHRDHLGQLPMAMSVDESSMHQPPPPLPKQRDNTRRQQQPPPAASSRLRNRRQSNNPLSAGPIIRISGPAGDGDRRPSQMAGPMPRRPSQVLDFIKRAADNSNNNSPSGSFGASRKTSGAHGAHGGSGGTPPNRFALSSPSHCFGLSSPSLDFGRTPSPGAWPSPPRSEVMALKSRSERFTFGDVTVKPSSGGCEAQDFDSAFSTKRALINEGKTLRTSEKSFREESLPSAFSFNPHDILQKRGSKGSNASSSSGGTPPSVFNFNLHRRKKVHRNSDRFPPMRDCTGINLPPIKPSRVLEEKQNDGPPPFSPVHSPKAESNNTNTTVPPPFRRDSVLLPPPVPFSKGRKVPPTPPAIAIASSIPNTLRNPFAAPTPPPPPPNVIAESRSFRGMSDPTLDDRMTATRKSRKMSRAGDAGSKTTRKSSRAGHENGTRSRKASRAGHENTGRKSRKSSRAGYESTTRRSRSRKSSRAGFGTDGRRSRKSSRAGLAADGRRSRKMSRAGEDDDILRANTIAKPPTLPRRSKSLHRQRRRPSIMSGGK